MPRLYIVIFALLGFAAGCDAGPDREKLYALHDEGRFVETIEPLRELLRADPDDPELNYRLGLALLADQQFGMAVWPLRRAADAPEFALQARLELAWAAHRNGSYEDSINAATRVLEQEPENLDALYVRGQSYLLANREEEALESFAMMEEIQPEAPTMWLSRALALARLDRIEEAGEQIARLRERVGKEAAFADPLMCSLEAVFFSESGDIDSAERAHEACLSEHPDAQLVLQNAVDFYEQTERPERALELLRETLDRQPGATPLRDKIANRLRGSGDVEAAEQLIREGVEFDSGPAPWLSLVYHFEVLRQPEDARQAMAKALERMPKAAPEFRFAYADMSIRAGAYDEALEQIRHLPFAGYGSMIRGRIAFSKGDFEAAYSLLEDAVTSQPDNPGLRHLAGQAAERLGKFDYAVSHYREAIRIDEPGALAGLDLARLLDATGNLPGAVVAILSHQKLNPTDLDGLRAGASLAARQDLPDAVSAQVAKMQTLVGPGEIASIRATLAAEADDLEGAAKIIQEADLDLAAPANHPALRTLVQVLLDAGRTAEAQDAVSGLAAGAPTDPHLAALSGWTLEASDREAADAAYARALEVDPNEAIALRGRARIAALRGDIEAAQSLNDRALVVDPEDDEAAWNAIEIAQAEGGREEIVRRLKQRLRANPRDGKAALLLARLSLKDDAKASRSFARRATRLRVGPEAAEAAAEAEVALGRPEVAVEVLQRVLENHPERSQTQYFLGLAHLAGGNVDPAIKALEASLAGEPFERAEDAKRQLAKLGRGTGV